MAHKSTLFFFFLICIALVRSFEFKQNEEFISSIEDTMEKKFGEYADSVTEWLKAINDKNLINSDTGRLLHYQELEPKVETAGNAVEGRNMKKMTSLLPLIFHLGMTSAWMLLTTILTAKSVAIGLTLLVMKIAVGSAKLASYFTAWKHKHHHPTHYEYVPHHEHHGHKRSLRSVESHIAHQDWHGYSPEHTQAYSPYSSHFEASSPYSSAHEASSPYYAQAYGEYEYPAETKKAQEKKISVDEEDSSLEAKSKSSNESSNQNIPPSRGHLYNKIASYPPFSTGGNWEPKDSFPFETSSGGFWDLFY